MSDVTLTYKGSDILELSDSGSATLKTGGTYCEADIEVEYVKPSGGGVWDKVTSVIISTLRCPNENQITIDLPNAKVNCTDLVREGAYASGSSIVINCLSVTSLYRAFSKATGLSTVQFNLSNANYINITDASEMQRQSSVKRLLGTKLLLTSNGANSYAQIWDAREFYLVENRLTGATAFNRTNHIMEDETLISVANAINATSTNTLLLTAAMKSRLSEIFGTVSHKTYNETMETEEEFDFFTADANGTVTLLDFITNTKGWTVA